MSVELKLHNTLTKKAEPVSPMEDGRPIGFYSCGPTVYGFPHIGNYRTFLLGDLFKRTARRLGYSVRHVMNITDVGHLTSQADEGEDKMAVAAAREGKTAWDIARFYTENFLADGKRFNLDFNPVENPAREYRPEAVDILCKATDHIEEQMKMVDRLIEDGFTYETADGIYFDTSKFPDYGVLTGGAHISGLQEGARVSMGEKKRITDFALWKFSPSDEKRQMEWDYRGRKGFPGWHVECSAMGQTYLGDTFDVHSGGVDLIPIHHTNEIAQAEAATGKKPFVRFWLHGEFIVLRKGKMSKSEGTFVTMADLDKKGYDPLDYRYFCFSAHYRKQLEFSWEALDSAKKTRRRLCELAQQWKKESDSDPVEAEKEASVWIENFKKEIANDLNAPSALGCLHTALSSMKWASSKVLFLEEAEEVLALGLFEEKEESSLSPDLQDKFDRYVVSRKEKDYGTSDTLRKELLDSGIAVKDTKEGSSWSRK